MQERFRDNKIKKSRNEGQSANEIHKKTFFLHWPVLLWEPNDANLISGSKKDLIYKKLQNKPAGLYFFTPGLCETNVDIHAFDKISIQAGQHSLKFLNKVSKDFNRKFSDSEDWKQKCNRRLWYLKKILSAYENFKSNDLDSLFLEQEVYFAATEYSKPSFFIDHKSLLSVEKNDKFPIVEIIKCLKSLPCSLDESHKSLIKEHSDVPAAFFYRYLIRKQIPANLLQSVLLMNKKAVIPVLEEYRLLGRNLSTETFRPLTLLLNEINLLYSDNELRSQLALDFIKSCYLMKDSYKENCPKLQTTEQLHKNFKLTLENHFKRRNFTFSFEDKKPIELISWFTGSMTKNEKKSLGLKSSFNSEESRQSFFLDCEKALKELLKSPPQSYHLGLLYSFCYLNDASENKYSNSLTFIIRACREFVPSGTSGEEAVRLCGFIFYTFKNYSKEELEYILSITHNHFENILTYCFNHLCKGNFQPPTFDNMSTALKPVLNFLVKTKDYDLDLWHILHKGRINFLIYVFGDRDLSGLEWIVTQKSNWIDLNFKYKSDWYYIMALNHQVREPLLEWASTLSERKVCWADIASHCYDIHYECEDDNSNQLVNNFEIVDKIYLISKELDKILKEDRGLDYYCTFADVSYIISHLKLLKDGWRLKNEYFKVFSDYYLKTASSMTKEKQFDLYHDDDRIKWFSEFIESPEELQFFLEISPDDYTSKFSLTLESLKWIKKNTPKVFAFLKDFMVDLNSFRKVMSQLHSFNSTIRLNQKTLKSSLEYWQTEAENNNKEALSFYRNISNSAKEFPREINRCLNMKERFEKEAMTLENLFRKGKLSSKASQRLYKLRSLLCNPAQIAELQKREIAKVLPNALTNAKINALIKINEEMCHSHWATISGREIDHWSNDWANALQLCFSTDKNKRLLKRLMHNAAGHDHQWIYYHPENVNYLKKVQDKIIVDEWLTPSKQSISINSKSYTIEAEQNLLKILHMGNYFGSCLSVGECNDFSTIANAVEINKHVLWLKNKNAKVIGRKLIVFDQKQKLYGFNSYGAALTSNNHNPWIKIFFDAYCAQIAKNCQLELSNIRGSEELNIFAQWYDDGIELFDWWTTDLQKGLSLEEISEKAIFDIQKPENFRAALWCKYKGINVSKAWEECPNFIKTLKKTF